MSVIYFLLTLSIIVAAIFLLVFIWSLKNGQYEDDSTPAIRILFEDKPKNNVKKHISHSHHAQSLKKK